MRYPLIEPEAVVARCSCYSEVRNCGGVRKHFRFLPTDKPCEAHGKASS